MLITTAAGQESDKDKPDMSLPPVTVRGIRVAPELPSERMRVQIFFDLRLGLGWPATPGALITPGRVPQTPKNIPFTTAGFAFDLNELSSGEPARLRGLRTIFLRDRLPAANPFDDSVPWEEMPRAILGRIEIVAGGGATAWNGAAMGGAIQFFTRPPSGQLITEKGNGRGRAIDGGPLKRQVRPVAELIASFDTLGGRQAEWLFAQPTSRGVLQLQGGIHATDGFDVLAGPQRGVVDQRAWRRGRWLEAHWRQPAGKERELMVSLRAYENFSGSGTREQQRQAEGTRLTLAMAGNRTGEMAWNGAIYFQNDDAEGSLTSIDGLRLSETPARRLTAVPASAIGASWTGAWWHRGDERTIVGFDVRQARGESREEYAFGASAFQRESVAGGKESRIGLSVLRQQPLGPAVRSTFGARFEAWDDASGRRREIDRGTGTVLRDDRFPSEQGAGVVPSAGVVWEINKTWRLRANGQSTARQPALAERYQSWGGQGILIEAAPALGAEKNLSVEAALDYGISPGLTFNATAFRNRLRDLIATRETSSPTALPGLAVRQRINLDEAIVQGLQVSANRRFGSFSVSGRFSLSDAHIAASPLNPSLAGKKLPFIPNRMASFSAGWQTTKQLNLSFGLNSIGRQYADEENTRRIPAAVLGHLRIFYRFSRQAQFTLRVENIGNVRHETNRDPAGLRYLGSPRVAAGEIRLAW